MSTFKELAAKLAANGYSPVPIGPGTKWPPMNEWQYYEIAEGDIERYAEHGVGIICGNDVIGLDIDLLDKAALQAVAKAWEEQCPDIFAKIKVSAKRTGLAPKVLLPFRAAVPGMRKKDEKLIPPAGGKAQGVEVLGLGQQFVGYGIHPGTGQPYQWNGAGDLTTIPLEELQPLGPEEVDRLLDVVKATLAGLGWTAPPAKAGSGTGDILKRDKPVTLPAIECLPPTLRGLLQWADPEDYDSWVAVGHALKMAATKDGLDEMAAEEAWLAWSQTSPKWRERDAERWSSFRPSKSAGLHSICAALGVKPHVEAALRFEMHPAAAPEGAGAPDDGEMTNDIFEQPTTPQKPAALAVLQAWQPRTPVEMQKIEPVEFGVAPLFQSGHVGLWPAKGGTGKTSILEVLGVCHALGVPFFGHPVKQGTFVLLSLDDPQADLDGALARIIEAWPGGLTEEQIATIGEKVRVVSLRGKEGGKLIKPVGDKGHTFAPSALVPGLAAWLDDIPDLVGVALDTVRQFTGVDSSNEPAGLALMHIAARFAEGVRKPYVVLAHHIPKASARSGIEDMHISIGTTALPDNSRFVLMLTDLAPEEVKGAEVPFGADLVKLEPMRGSLLVKKADPFIVARTGFRFELLAGAQKKSKEEKKVDATAETRAKHVASLIKIFEAHGVVGRDRAKALGWTGRRDDWNDQSEAAKAALQGGGISDTPH